MDQHRFPLAVLRLKGNKFYGCYRTYAHLNKNCLTEFARSRTTALRTAALLHVLFVALHFVINYLFFTL